MTQLPEGKSQAARRYSTNKQLRIDWCLIHAVGLTNAVFINNLINRQGYFSDRDALAEDGSFYRTIAAQQFDTGLTEHAIRTAKRYFTEQGVLKVEGRGVPYKEFYDIDYDALDELVSRNPPPYSPQDFRKYNDPNQEEHGAKGVRSATPKHADSQPGAKGGGSATLNGSESNTLIGMRIIYADKLSSKEDNDAARRHSDDTGFNNASPDSQSRGPDSRKYGRRAAMQRTIPPARQTSNNGKRYRPLKAVQARRGNTEGQAEPTPQADRIIEAWNAMPGVSQVRLSDPPTKTLTRVRALLSNLLAGRFMTYGIEGGSVAKLERFADRNDIDTELLSQSWTEDEITGVLTAALGHPLCPDKPSLPGVLFNGFSQGKKNRAFSLFILAANECRQMQPYTERAYRLADIVQGVSQARVTDRQVQAWAGDIRWLIKEYRISLSRIDTALAWYNKHSGDAYVPVILNGRDLFNKFAKLEAAANRQAAGRVNGGGSGRRGLRGMRSARPAH